MSATAQAPGIFARIFDIDEVTVRAEAQARVFAPSELKDVAPIAVHTDMACIVTDPTCFGQPEDADLRRGRASIRRRASSASSTSTATASGRR